MSLFNIIKTKLKNNRTFISIFLIIFLFFSIWVVAFYPGILTPDSVAQWIQAKNFSFDNHHPYFHTLIIAVLQRIMYNPIAYVLLQIFIASFTSTYVFTSQIKFGIRKPYIYLSTILLLLYPAIGLYNVSLWKDIPFSYLLILTAFVSFQFVSRKRLHILNSKKDILEIILFSILIVLTSSLRHNGIILIFVIPLILYFCKAFSFRSFILNIVVNIILYIFISVILLGLLQVRKPNFIGSTPFLHMVGAALDGGYIPTKYESNVIEELIPIASLIEKYSCLDSNPIVYSNPDFNLSKIEEKEYIGDFNTVAFSIIRKNLPQVLGNRFCLFFNTVATQQNTFLYGDLFNSTEVISQTNIPTSTNNIMTEILSRVVKKTSTIPILEVIFWNPILFIMLLGSLVLLKRDKATNVLVGILSINLIGLFLGGVGPDFRFVYYINIAGILFLPMLIEVGVKSVRRIFRSHKNL